MMQVLLEAQGKEFFSSTKQMRNKNRTTKQLSPYAEEFFWIFLKQRWAFVKLVSQAFFHLDDGMSIKLGLWLPFSWNIVSDNLKLGIIDLKHIPNWTILEVALLRSLICGFHRDTIKAVKIRMIDPLMWL